MMKPKWWRRWVAIRQARSFEVYCFNYASHSKWLLVKRENEALGVWNGTFKLPEDR